MAVGGMPALHVVAGNNAVELYGVTARLRDWIEPS